MLSSQGMAKKEPPKALAHPAGARALSALKLSFAELLQLCVPGQESACVCLCHPQVKPWHLWGFYCRLTTTLGNLLRGTVLQMAEDICTSSFQCFHCNITANHGQDLSDRACSPQS